MDAKIRAFVDGVPLGWVPKFHPMGDDERLVGRLADLDDDTRRIVRAAFFYTARVEEMIVKHDREHKEGKVTSGSRECDNHDALLKLLAAQIDALQAAADPALKRRFTLNSAWGITFRREGIVATMKEGAAGQVVARTTGANTEAPDNNGPETRAIEDLLLEVPPFYRFAPFPLMAKDERYLAQLAWIDSFTFRMIRGIFFFLELGAEVNEAHKQDHAQPGFKGGGEACRLYLDRIQTLDQKVTKLQNASRPRLEREIDLEAGEKFAFRREGIVATHRMEELSVLPKPGEHPCETPTPALPIENATSPARRSLMSRILHRPHA